MGTCRRCKCEGVTISDTIGFCAHCIRDGFEEVRPEIEAVHHRSRRAYGLPPEMPTCWAMPTDRILSRIFPG